MFGIQKLIATIIGPFVVKGLMWFSTTVGAPELGAEAQVGIIGLIVAGLVYFIPNKLKGA